MAVALEEQGGLTGSRLISGAMATEVLAAEHARRREMKMREEGGLP